MKIIAVGLLFFTAVAIGQDSVFVTPILPDVNTHTYRCDSVLMTDHARRPDGFWLFEPRAPMPDSAKIIVFLHGYGAFNPMLYGQWIRHLVQQGHVVIFPRYQRDLFRPRPGRFHRNTQRAITDALQLLSAGDHPRHDGKSISLVGHSYGGVVAAGLAARRHESGLPEIDNVLVCAPGTSRLKGGRLKSYQDIPAETRLAILVCNDDAVVGDEFAWLVYNTASQVVQRAVFRQFADSHGQPAIKAHHNQSYALDPAFDTGVRNYTAKRALRVAALDAVDYLGHWRLLDALLRGESLLSRAEDFRDLGRWSDGTPIRPLELTLPADPAATPTVGTAADSQK